jgi:electron transport complex protein RnfC
LPSNLIIPITQHTGTPAKVLVNKGDKVKAGQLIAESSGFVSANIHASCSGTVLKVDSYADSTGYRRTSVNIQVEGDEWIDGIIHNKELVRECSMNREEIINKIKEGGLVGMGGAAFPTHVKLTIPQGKRAEYLVINGVECEPYLTADHVLMVEKGPEIIAGIKILMKALGVEKALIGIENNKPDAIENMTKLAASEKGITVRPLKVKYPQGGEKQLISALLGREVPSGGLPVDVGVVAFNIGTVFAVYELVQKNKPLVERVVTVTGKSLPQPSNFLVRIGTPVQILIEAAGGLPDDTGKVINGGPMMGKAMNSLEIPVVKGTSGILILPSAESRRRETVNCIRCTKCIRVCPMGLEPYLLMSLAERGSFERCEKERIMDCMECGSCSYTCPSFRPLLDYIRLGKSRVGILLKARKN